MTTEEIRVTIEYRVDGKEHSSSTFAHPLQRRIAPVYNDVPLVVGHTFVTPDQFGGGVVRIVGSLHLKNVDEPGCKRRCGSEGNGG